jgi:hypothetical protein
LELSWAAVVFIPTVLTPAILLYFMFRLLIPKAKSPPSNDLMSLMIFILLSFLINIQLIGYTVENLWPAYISSEKVMAVYKNIIGLNDYDPFRPFISIYSCLVNDFLPTNILGIFLDLHLRVLLIGLIVCGLYHLFLLFKWVVDENFHGKWPSTTLNKVLNKIFDPFKKYFFSYWNYVFDFDENLEVLMIDVNTETDELYSGLFVDWTPDDDISRDAIGSLGMTNILKYESKGSGTNPSPSNEVKSGHFNLKPSNRRWRLIQNDGTMYIPYSRVNTIHIWKIKRGSTLNLWVNDSNKNERLKWYLMLASKKQKFITKITVNVKVESQEDADNYIENLLSWVSENDLDEISSVLNIEVYSENSISNQ